MKIRNLPHEIRQAYKAIKDIKGFQNNTVAISYCIAVTSERLKQAIEEDLRQRTKQEKELNNAE